MIRIHRSLTVLPASAHLINRGFLLLFVLIAVSVLYRFSLLGIKSRRALIGMRSSH